MRVRKTMKTVDSSDEYDKKTIDHGTFANFRTSFQKYRFGYVIFLCILMISCREIYKVYDRWKWRTERLKILQESIHGVKLGLLVELAHKFGLKTGSDVTLQESIKSFTTKLIKQKQKQLSHSRLSSQLSSSSSSASSLRRLLCSTFINADESSLKTLTNRLYSMIDSCDWFIFIYGGNMTMASNYKENIASMELPRNNRIIGFEYNVSRKDVVLQYGIFPGSKYEDVRQALQSSPYNQKMFPKPMLMATLIPILDQYRYVWIFDGDISISSVNITRLLTNIECAFESPPYVSQALIFEDTQAYEFLNYKSWSSVPEVIASETGFIEIQAPIFRAEFLEWYLRNIVGRAMWPMHILGADWGFDFLFCKTASHFAHELVMGQYKSGMLFLPILETMSSINNSNTNSSSSNSMISRVSRFRALNERHQDNEIHQAIREYIVPCAVIVDGNPIRHQDSKAIDKSMGYRIRTALNHELMSILQKSFPSFTTKGLDPKCNPLNPKTNYRISKQLIDQCVIPSIGNIENSQDQ